MSDPALVALVERLRALAADFERESLIARDCGGDEGGDPWKVDAQLLREAADALSRPVAAPPEGTPPQANQALRQLYDAFGVFDGYDDCEDCGDKSEAGNDEPCRFHGSQKLWDALVAAERALGPCECGHATDDHFKEDTTRCRVCECHGFRLPAVAALFPHDGSRT